MYHRRQPELSDSANVPDQSTDDAADHHRDHTRPACRFRGASSRGAANWCAGADLSVVRRPVPGIATRAVPDAERCVSMPQPASHVLHRCTQSAPRVHHRAEPGRAALHHPDSSTGVPANRHRRPNRNSALRRTSRCSAGSCCAGCRVLPDSDIPLHPVVGHLQQSDAQHVCLDVPDSHSTAMTLATFTYRM